MSVKRYIVKMKTLLIYITAAILLLASCAGRATRPDSAEEELSRAKKILEKDREQFVRINRVTYPGNGYFYILSPAGIILRHPEKALEGVNYSSYDFIEKIIRTKSGCISLDTGGRVINIFYSEFKNGDILCLTFESSAAEKTYKECITGSRKNQNERIQNSSIFRGRQQVSLAGRILGHCLTRTWT